MFYEQQLQDTRIPTILGAQKHRFKVRYDALSYARAFCFILINNHTNFSKNTCYKEIIYLPSSYYSLLPFLQRQCFCHGYHLFYFLV